MSTRTTPLALAKTFATAIRKAEGISADCEYGPRVRNATEVKAHGWMPDALATVSYEGGIDLIDLLGEQDWCTADYYIDAYSTYMVGVYRR